MVVVGETWEEIKAVEGSFTWSDRESVPKRLVIKGNIIIYMT